MMCRIYGARSPHSHYDIIFVVTSFATELATPAVTDVRTYGHEKEEDCFYVECSVSSQH